MLTYRQIYNDNNILRYQYFPYGKDYKIKGGIVEFNIIDESFNIIEVAQLDEKIYISEQERNQIIHHINQLRKNENIHQIKEQELNKIFIDYKFAEILINEIFLQIKNNDIKNKGIVF